MALSKAHMKGEHKEQSLKGKKEKNLDKTCSSPISKYQKTFEVVILLQC